MKLLTEDKDPNQLKSQMETSIGVLKRKKSPSQRKLRKERVKKMIITRNLKKLQLQISIKLKLRKKMILFFKV